MDNMFSILTTNFHGTRRIQIHLASQYYNLLSAFWFRRNFVYLHYVTAGVICKAEYGFISSVHRAILKKMDVVCSEKTLICTSLAGHVQYSTDNFYRESWVLCSRSRFWSFAVPLTASCSTLPVVKLYAFPILLISFKSQPAVVVRIVSRLSR